VAEQCLGDAAGTVNRVVVRVCAVGTSYPADVLRGESLAELPGPPELGGHLGWGDELVPRGPLATGTLALAVVRRQVRAAATITVPRWPGSHSAPLRC
jgi:hypothetical protein